MYRALSTKSAHVHLASEFSEAFKFLTEPTSRLLAQRFAERVIYNEQHTVVLDRYAIARLPDIEKGVAIFEHFFADSPQTVGDFGSDAIAQLAREQPRLAISLKQQFWTAAYEAAPARERQNARMMVSLPYHLSQTSSSSTSNGASHHPPSEPLGSQELFSIQQQQPQNPTALPVDSLSQNIPLGAPRPSSEPTPLQASTATLLSNDNGTIDSFPGALLVIFGQVKVLTPPR